MESVAQIERRWRRGGSVRGGRRRPWARHGGAVVATAVRVALGSQRCRRWSRACPRRRAANALAAPTRPMMDRLALRLAIRLLLPLPLAQSLSLAHSLAHGHLPLSHCTALPLPLPLCLYSCASPSLSRSSRAVETRTSCPAAARSSRPHSLLVNVRTRTRRCLRVPHACACAFERLPIQSFLHPLPYQTIPFNPPSPFDFAPAARTSRASS
eukprot:6208301-Pleurochrysis_carterae.AAC.1